MTPRHGLAIAAAGVVLCLVGLIGGFVFAEDTESSSPPTSSASTTSTVEATTTTTIDPASLVGLEQVQAFYAAFEAAVHAGDGDPLYATLHPAVLELYGAEQCEAFIDGGFDNPDLDFEAVAVGPLEPWTWERDGRTVEVGDAVAVDLVQRTPANPDPAPQEAHLALVDDEIRWFTDCGEPLA